MQSLKPFFNNIICGDALEVLKTFPDESVDCVVTSPPYWTLRDYGVAGQLGLEPSLPVYLMRLGEVFDEVKRVLKNDGTCWVNLGDTFSNSTKGSGGFGEMGDAAYSRVNKRASFHSSTAFDFGLPEKCLAQLPARFAIELCQRGWILRNEIIWWKPNAMPESVRDRLVIDYEKLFFFVKQKHYWFDQDAVREPHNAKNRQAAIREAEKLGYDRTMSYKQWYFEKRQPRDWNAKKKSLVLGKNLLRGIPKPWLVHPLGRAKRCVWAIPTNSFDGEHYATYPPQLVETPIKAGCPKGGIVLDPFIGSGTTALVARKLGRKYIGIDLNRQYVKLAKQRLRAAANG